MSAARTYSPSGGQDPEAVKELYEKYAQKLFHYTHKNYSISIDDAWTIVYKTIYKMANVKERYSFENENRRSAFIFKMHINFLRNHFRDDRTYENKSEAVPVHPDLIPGEEAPLTESGKMKILKEELDKLDEWQRILLLMRGQGLPYSEIAAFVDKPENQLKVYYARLKKMLFENITNELEKQNTLSDAKK